MLTRVIDTLAPLTRCSRTWRGRLPLSSPAQYILRLLSNSKLSSGDRFQTATVDGAGFAEGKLLEGLVHPRDQQVQGDGLLGVQDHVVLCPQGLLLLKKVKMRGAEQWLRQCLGWHSYQG